MRVERGVVTERDARHVRANYGSKLSMIDHWFGRVLDRDRQLGDDVAVIVCTDHGHYLGEHDTFGKPGSPIWNTLGHVPLMIRWPGARPGRSSGADHHRRSACHAVRHVRGRTRAPHPRRVHGAAADRRSVSVRDHLLAGYWSRHVYVIDQQRTMAARRSDDGLPLAMWSNRWSSMPIWHAAPQYRFPRPDVRATLGSMPGSTAPVIRQPFSPGDLLPFWAYGTPIDDHHLYDADDADRPPTSAVRSPRPTPSTCCGMPSNDRGAVSPARAARARIGVRGGQQDPAHIARPDRLRGLGRSSGAPPRCGGAAGELMTRVTGCPGTMWRPSIVGFGRYHYRYDSGREGDFMLTGFSPRKANLVVHVLPGYDDIGDDLALLGKHRIGKSCLYINKLADIDLSVLERIIADGVSQMRKDYETWDDLTARNGTERRLRRTAARGARRRSRNERRYNTVGGFGPCALVWAVPIVASLSNHWGRSDGHCGGYQASKRSMVLLTTLATVGATFTTGASAQELMLEPDVGSKDVVESDSGSYIVVMEAEPLVVHRRPGQPRHAGRRAIAQTTSRPSRTRLSRTSAATPSDKVNTYTNALNGFSAFLTYEEAQALAANPKVASVQPDELRQADTNASPEYLGLTVNGGACDSGITGEDVVVGVIDTGIWPEHPSFADDGSYGPSPVGDLDDVLDRPASSATRHTTRTTLPFTCNNKLLGARQMLDTYRALIGAEPFEFDSARDDDGHGTHTASTAAGNAGVAASMYGVDLGEVSGIAPRARVIAYKGLGDLGGFTSDLAAAIDQAVADGVDVINYSIGGGASLPIGADDIAFLFAADAGVFVATSAGNSGPGAGTVGSPGNAPWITTVGANTQKRFFEGTCPTKGGAHRQGRVADARHRRSDRDFVDAEFAGGDLCYPWHARRRASFRARSCCVGVAPSPVRTRALLSYQAGGVGMIMYNNSDDDNLYTDTHCVPSVHVDHTDGLQGQELHRQGGRQGQDATGRDQGHRQGAKAKVSPIDDASSRHAAPTAGVPTSSSLTSPRPACRSWPAIHRTETPVGNSFQAIAGTSMSSPHVAGLFALIKQAHPDWSAAAGQVGPHDDGRHRKSRTMIARPGRPRSSMGSGEVDPGKVDKKGSAFNPGLVYDAGLFEYAAFTCGADLGVFTPGSCSFLDRSRYSVRCQRSQLSRRSVSPISPDRQTVVRTVTSVADKTVTWQGQGRCP